MCVLCDFLVFFLSAQCLSFCLFSLISSFSVNYFCTFVLVVSFWGVDRFVSFMCVGVVCVLCPSFRVRILYCAFLSQDVYVYLVLCWACVEHVLSMCWACVGHVRHGFLV